MVGARFLRVRENGSGFKQLFLVLVLISALFVAILPAGKVMAARSNRTKSEAYNKCKNEWHLSIPFNEKKHWVPYKKGYMCTEIVWDAGGTGDQKWRVQCQKTQGDISTKENGVFNCMWPDGFKEEKDENGSVIDDGKHKADVEIVVGGVDANKDCVGSTIIWNKKDEKGRKLFCDDSEGAGVYEILLIVINILSGLAGTLALVGIVISGITYLTSRDNVAQQAKAKKRIIQIAIGLAIYVGLYTLAQWLIPGGIFGG